MKKISKIISLALVALSGFYVAGEVLKKLIRDYEENQDIPCRDDR